MRFRLGSLAGGIASLNHPANCCDPFWGPYQTDHNDDPKLPPLLDCLMSMILIRGLSRAFPVVTGVVLSTVQRGRLDLAYAPYGTFFSWFALMAWAATATIRQGGETRC